MREWRAFGSGPMANAAAVAMTARMTLPDSDKTDIDKTGKPNRGPIPGHIARGDVELTAGALACTDCGGRLRRVGKDVTEELESVPGRFIASRIVWSRLACARFAHAPLPTYPVARGRVCGPMNWSASMPTLFALYRQRRIFEREGLDLDRSILADWAGKSTTLPEPAADAIGRHALCRRDLADDTPVSMLPPGTGKTQTARP